MKLLAKPGWLTAMNDPDLVKDKHDVNADQRDVRHGGRGSSGCRSPAAGTRETGAGSRTRTATPGSRPLAKHA
jgi:hypothetical protein